MATLSHNELETLWIDAGGAPFVADVAAAIAQAESGGCQYALAGPVDIRPVRECTYRQTTLENSCGLWQINLDAHPSYSAPTIFNLADNAAAAIAISGNGNSFNPWTTFTTGAYLQYLAAGGPGSQPPPVTVSSEVQASLASATHQVSKSWMQLMRTLGVTVPQDLHKVALANARIRKAVR